MTEECDTKLTSWCGVSHRNTGSRSLPEKVSSRNLSNHSSVKADVGKPRWNKAHSMHGFTPSQAGRRDVKLTQMVSCTRRKVGMAFTFGTARAIVESSFMPLSCRCSHESSSARIRIYDAATGEPHLVVAGISIHRLNTSHEITKLVGELRHELGFCATAIELKPRPSS
jgi:hypothetical protein